MVYEIMHKLRNRFQTLWADRASEIEPPTIELPSDEAYRKGYTAGYWMGIADGVDVGVSEGVIEVDVEVPQLRA